MTIPMAQPRITNPDDLSATLMANLAAFQGFARRRTGNDDLAADAVQESLMRAMKAEPTLAHREDLIAWTRLVQTCQLCATHGCLDCDCAPHS